jgi:hypothetical protein
MIDPLTVKDYLEYDPHTGVFMRKKGRVSYWLNYWFKGNPTSRGYLEISYCGIKHVAHQLAWFMVHGEIVRYLDHINGDVTDNRLCNLRISDPKRNQKNRKFNANNTSGESGITIEPNGKYRVRIRLNKALNNLGTYSTMNEAISVRDKFYQENGFDEQHGVRGKNEIQS